MGRKERERISIRIYIGDTSLLYIYISREKFILHRIYAWGKNATLEGGENNASIRKDSHVHEAAFNELGRRVKRSFLI